MERKYICIKFLCFTSIHKAKVLQKDKTCILYSGLLYCKARSLALTWALGTSPLWPEVNSWVLKAGFILHKLMEARAHLQSSHSSFFPQTALLIYSGHSQSLLASSIPASKWFVLSVSHFSWDQPYLQQKQWYKIKYEIYQNPSNSREAILEAAISSWPRCLLAVSPHPIEAPFRSISGKRPGPEFPHWLCLAATSHVVSELILILLILSKHSQPAWLSLFTGGKTDTPTLNYPVSHVTQRENQIGSRSNRCSSAHLRDICESKKAIIALSSLDSKVAYLSLAFKLIQMLLNENRWVNYP